MITLRPSDLAREHGISPQAVRNYERDGFIPPAERTRSGYRIYTEAHAAALRAYLSLIPAYGYSAGGRIMKALHNDALDEALAIIDQGHSQLLRDRETLDAVRKAIDHLTAGSDATPDQPSDPGPRTVGDDRPTVGGHRRTTGEAPRTTGEASRTIGELAHQLRVTPATLRKWEGAGILVPVRDPATGYRVFGASDVRDAELAHLLRRGGYPLEQIATVVQQIRTAGGTDTLAGALDDWQRKLTARGLAMLSSATRLSHCLSGQQVSTPPVGAQPVGAQQVR
ncbi:MerR family DNA-binding transcriptional regulator [Streptomyces sp. NBC_01186]|uniref:MerR family transcriptional regulator n=1 Tax=unclassified Streptomyces TaxID=2593676 RepID=UPI002DDA6EE1|nr:MULTISPECIES: MerR family transcriptional regulator [unclassified Streptomyces]WSB77737.1 MerR family DNA-binding transcriptional regulator [Streptomyces sp. NBC_01775]WSS14014.1 MerR family DNA-binding transcriptional regulator [Streptomyces sp. NBC_01186]